MRLIDADKLIISAENTFARPNGFIQLIEETETAYDVDAVAEEIQKAYCKKCRNILGVAGAEAYCKEQKCDIYAVYDIVRRSGVE